MDDMTEVAAATDKSTQIIARAFWVENYLAENPDKTPKEAFELCKDALRDPTYRKIVRKALKRVEKKGVKISWEEPETTDA